MFIQAKELPGSDFYALLNNSDVDFFEAEHCSADRDEIHSMIKNYINIEIALSQQFFFSSNCGVEVPVSVCMLDCEDRQEMLSIQKIYRKLAVTTSAQGNVIDITAQRPHTLALDVFGEMLEKGEINPFIVHFLFEKPPAFCRKQQDTVLLFQPDKEIPDDGRFSADDPFLQYFFGMPHKAFNCPAILLNGYTPAELESDSFFLCICRVVKRAYLAFVPYDLDADLYLLQIRWEQIDK